MRVYQEDTGTNTKRAPIDERLDNLNIKRIKTLIN